MLFIIKLRKHVLTSASTIGLPKQGNSVNMHISVEDLHPLTMPLFMNNICTVNISKVFGDDKSVKTIKSCKTIPLDVCVPFC